MKFLIIPLFLLTLFTNIFASPEEKGKITGKVLDADTKKPVDYATISIYKQGVSSPFNGSVTDPNGNFKIENINPGDYTITVDFIGYKQQKLLHVIVGGSAGNSVSIGTIYLSPSQNQLKEVSITANAPSVENKVDKLVYNPANDLTAQGGTATDILKKVPMVSVDLDGNVDLMGNSNIRFLINGKPSTIFGASIADALASIPASQIKNIEVITNPGAKYDAEGTGGIINIILKESTIQGVNGNINLTAGTRLENGSLNLTARKGNIGVNAFFNGRGQLASTTINSSDNHSTSSFENTATHLTQYGKSTFSRSGYQSGISFNWDVSKKDQITLSFNFNHFGNQNDGSVNQEQVQEHVIVYNNFFEAIPSFTDTTSINNSNSKFSNNTADLSLSYKKTFAKKDQELDILLDYSNGNSTNNYSQLQNFTNVIQTPIGSIGNNPGTDKEAEFSIDYTQPFTDNFIIETGTKLGVENLNNSVVTQTLVNSVFTANPSQSYSFNYKRNIFAYYLSTSFSVFHNFINGKAGLRYEFTSSTTDYPNTLLPSYGIFAPSYVLSHKFDKTQSIKFSYSYRLQRPEYRELNPFYNISDPHNISTGDPNLKPELGHNYELGYNHSFDKGANIYVAVFYRYNTNDLQSIITPFDTLRIGNTVYTNGYLNKSANIGQEVDEGVNLYGSLPVGGKLSFRSNMFFADRITTNPGSPQVSGFIYRINLNTAYEFTKDLAAEFFINYRSSQRTIQGTNPAFYFYDIAVRKQFMNKKLSLGLTATNLFNKYINFNSTASGPNFYQTSLRQVPRQSFGINLNYKFGKLEFKKEREKQDNNIPDEGGGK